MSPWLHQGSMRDGQRLVHLVSAADIRRQRAADTLPGIPGVPIGAALDFRNKPTLFTAADFLTILPGLRNGLVQGLAKADQTIQAIQLTKQAGTCVFLSDYKTSSALHSSFGVQRELAHGFVLSADFAYRHFVHLALGSAVDLNHTTAL